MDKTIQNLRGMFLALGVDLTYTQMIQVLARLGADMLPEASGLNPEALQRVKDCGKRAGLRL